MASLIDGDGSITSRDTERRYWSVKVSMNDKEMIDYLLSIGGTFSQQLKRNRRRMSYGWYARAREAIARLEARIGKGTSEYLS